MRNESFFEEIKIESKVFDRRTLFTIFKLIQKGILKSVVSVVKEGKESVVVSARDKKQGWLAVKVYRVEFADFKSRWQYLVADPRFSRTRKNKWFTVLTWAQREFKNMKIAFNAGVRCPEPIFVNKNVLVMSFIGKNGNAAKDLIHTRLEDPQQVYEQVEEEMKKIAEAGLVHTDLSPYNILMYDAPYIIDFSQATTELNPLAKEFLIRDVKNINNYFSKLGANINEDLFEQLKKEMKLD